MTMSLTVEVPPEPDDRAVVLDRLARAWQRDEVVWRRVCAGSVVYLDETDAEAVADMVKTWPHLIVDLHPLTRLVPEAEQVDGWRNAGYADATCEHFVQPPSVSPEDASLPRHWTEGDPEPDDVTTVRDGSSETWEREEWPGVPEGSLVTHWRCTSDFGLGVRLWSDLTTRGPLVEPTAPSSEPAPDGVAMTADVALPAASATSFLRRVGSAPTFDDLVARAAGAPSPVRRAVRDEPQA